MEFNSRVMEFSMLKNQSDVILNFVRWLSGKYIELERKTLPYPCKLAGFTYKKNVCYAQVQFSGQSHFVEIAPEIIIEKNLFEYFSPNDKKLIFYRVYAHKNLTLSDQYRCPNTDEEMVVLTDKITNGKLTLPVSRLSIDQNLLNQMEPVDSNRICFLSGIEFIKQFFINKPTKEQ